MPQQQFLSVDEAYNRWSPIYDTYANPMVFMASEIVRRSLGDVRDLSVFEFGCGTGRNLALLESYGAKAAGCDLSPGMLEVARTRVGSANLFRHDMRQPLPVPDAAFDLALFCLSLEHVEDLQGPLTEAMRITRPGGRISVIEIHPYYSFTGTKAHFHADGVEVHMPIYPHRFADYLNAFGELGLTLAACREWRPVDVGNPPPLQSAKLGPEVPITVEFALRHAAR